MHSSLRETRRQRVGTVAQGFKLSEKEGMGLPIMIRKNCIFRPRRAGLALRRVDVVKRCVQNPSPEHWL